MIDIDFEEVTPAIDDMLALNPITRDEMDEWEEVIVAEEQARYENWVHKRLKEIDEQGSAPDTAIVNNSVGEANRRVR